MILAQVDFNKPKESTMIVMLAFLIGIVAGLRAMTTPAAVAWAAALGWFDASQTPLGIHGLSLDAVGLHSVCHRRVRVRSASIHPVP
jgi:hypothetical protein